MATHNQTRHVGYLLHDPQIINAGEEGEEKALFTIRVLNRDLDGYKDSPFQDILVFYDGNDALMGKMKKLEAFDMVDIKGVYNVLSLSKTSTCPVCGSENVKENGTACFIYPIYLLKINSLKSSNEHDESLPEEVLQRHYKEVSNQAFIMGNVDSDPESLGTEKKPACRYRLRIDRKYYIQSQNDIHVDYPYIYSYGKQAINDLKYLKRGALIEADCFLRARTVKSDIVCKHCGEKYQYDDIASELIPYSVEYLRDYYTAEEVEENERRAELLKELENS